LKFPVNLNHSIVINMTYSMAMHVYMVL
jgi:hypothetical protein